MNASRGYTHRRQAFTLMEMLTAVAVLSILSVMIFQIINSVSIATRQSSKRVDLYQEAAFVLDRITTDLQARSRRADQPFIISDPEDTQSNGNAYLEFYTNTPAYYSTTDNARSKLSKVAYRISTNDPNNSGTPVAPQLQRYVTSLYWSSGSTAIFLPTSTFTTPNITNANTAPTTDANDNANWQTLSKNVICFKLTYQLKDSGAITLTYTGTTDPNNPLPQNPATQNISALIITLALLDDSTLKVLSATDARDLMDFLNRTTFEPADQNSYLNAWNRLLKTRGLSGQHALIRQNLRFSQRLIPLN